MTLAISQTNINFAYLVASVCLIIGIKRLSSPATARSGNVIAAVGMAIAIAFTFLDPDIDTYWIILAGMAVGTVIGIASARMVKMTAIPQMVALFNGVGGGAAALIAAAEFHRRAPWKSVAGEETIEVRCDRLGKAPRYACIMGQMGMTRGVALYDDLAALTQIRNDDLLDLTLTEGDSVNLDADATDPKGESVTYSASGLPAGITINASTGVISGLLSPTSSGTLGIQTWC